ncbi:A1 cistron-splicing factor [Entophlyctis helioformis]|nr:A1 cistron-splicing factor [Entophlyctis helioformis]
MAGPHQAQAAASNNGSDSEHEHDHDNDTSGNTSGNTRGAVLLLLDVPVGTEIGIDCNVWASGPRFKGLCQLPAGTHFVHYSSPAQQRLLSGVVVGVGAGAGAHAAAHGQSPHGQPPSTDPTASSFRTGVFVSVAPGDLVVRRWNAATESLDLETDPDQVERFRHSASPAVCPVMLPCPAMSARSSPSCTDSLGFPGDTPDLREFEPFLGPYPTAQSDPDQPDTYRKWLRLASFVTKTVVSRILPASGSVSAMTSVSHFSDIPIPGVDPLQASASASASASTPSSRPAADPSLWSQDAQVRIRFTHINLKRSFPAGATGSLVTKYSLDKSYLLTSLLSSAFNNDVDLLLGEFQLAFIFFLLGQVYDGFEQWKAMVQLICFCREAMSTHPGLFVEFITQLSIQLEECPEDFFHDSLASESFLHSAIKALLVTSREEPETVPAAVAQAINRLSAFMQTRFDWDIAQNIMELDNASDQDDDEDDEYRPVIVEL